MSRRFDSQALEGKKPQERSLCGGGPLRGSAAGRPGGKLGALRERLSSGREQTGVGIVGAGSGSREDGRGQAEKLKVEAGADNQTVRYCEPSNLEEPINSGRVVAPGSRRDEPT